LTLRSPQLASVPIPPLPPLSPKKTPMSPRKLSPPKSLMAGNISDDNSKTIRPVPLTRPSQSRKVSTESNVSSNSNGSTMRAVSMSPSPIQTRVKTAPKIITATKKRSKGKKPTPREEHSDDGYEDLIKGDEGKFAQKINSLKVHLWGFVAYGSVTFRRRRDYFILLT
jgi:hypothetical protein